MALSGDDTTSPEPRSSSKPKSKKRFTVNPNLAASISSDGKVTNIRKDRPKSSSLGVMSSTTTTKRRRPNAKTPTVMNKKDRQRTANGRINSTLQSNISHPESETQIQVLEAKRGNKTVTIIRGMACPMEDRKNLLKEMKCSFGVGGTLVDGVLELQGSYAAAALQVLQRKGYKKAKRIGGK